MKFYLSLGILFFIHTSVDCRNDDGLPALHVFQQITVGLSMDYLQKGEPLPNSFEDIPFVARLAKILATLSLSII
jgi:hypothetical protein